MRVFQNSFVEFDVDNIERTLDYDLVIRYEPQVRPARTLEDQEWRNLGRARVW